MNAPSGFIKREFIDGRPTSNLGASDPKTVYFSFIFVFSYRKLVVSMIRTRMVGVEGEDSDHWTTTTAPILIY